ncbi:uncharacterized protein LOC144133892 [Amblyomma americanum]
MVWLKVGFVLLLCALVGAVPTNNRRRDPTDHVKLYTAFPGGVALFTSSNHTAFKCLSSSRIAFDPKAKTATYVWHFKGHSGHKRKDVSLHFFPGETPGQIRFYLNDEHHVPSPRLHFICSIMCRLKEADHVVSV